MKTRAEIDGDTCNVENLFVYQHTGTCGPDVAPKLELEREFIDEIQHEGVSLVVIENTVVVDGQLMIPVDIYWCYEAEAWMRKQCDHANCLDKNMNSRSGDDLDKWLEAAGEG